MVKKKPVTGAKYTRNKVRDFQEPITVLKGSFGNIPQENVQ